MSLKFLSRPEHRAEVSSRETLNAPRTQRSRITAQQAWDRRHEPADPKHPFVHIAKIVEAPMGGAAQAALASWGEPAAREVVLASPFVDARGDTLPSMPSAVAQSRALGFVGWRCP